jgi:hypothetical protein
MKNDYVTPKHWPEVPMELGKFYDVTDPQYPPTRIVTMLKQTFINMGTLIEKQKRTLEMQDKTIREMTIRKDIMERQIADLDIKYRNLRRAYRKGKRVELETELGPETVAKIEKYEADHDLIPPQPSFNPLKLQG